MTDRDMAKAPPDGGAFAVEQIKNNGFISGKTIGGRNFNVAERRADMQSEHVKIAIYLYIRILYNKYGKREHVQCGGENYRRTARRPFPANRAVRIRPPCFRSCIRRFPDSAFRGRSCGLLRRPSRPVRYFCRSHAERACVDLLDGEWYTLTVVNDYGAKTSAVYLTGERFGNGGKSEVAPLGERVFLGTYDFRNATAGDPDVFEMAIGSGKAGTSFTVDYIRSYAVKEDA